MSAPRALPDFKAKTAEDQASLGEEGARALLETGRAYDLSTVLRGGGTILFPHATITTCGHQIAAAVHACLESGARRVVALGVLHALNEELRASRERVAAGGRPEEEATRGIQGPGLAGREDWKREFSLDHFQFLWSLAASGPADAPGPGPASPSAATTSAACPGAGSRCAPELVLRYPFLAGGRPESLPGIEELRELARGAIVVATADPFHHGIGYDDPPSRALAPGAGGLALARETIQEGLAVLESGDPMAFERHCAGAKSDARDTGQVLRLLLGPLRGRILDLVADDMTGPYQAPAPTWVAGALIALDRL